MSTSKWLSLIFTTHLYKKRSLYYACVTTQKRRDCWIIVYLKSLALNNRIFFYCFLVCFLSNDMKQRSHFVVLRINQRQIAHFFIRYNNGLKVDKTEQILKQLRHVIKYAKQKYSRSKIMTWSCYARDEFEDRSIVFLESQNKKIWMNNINIYCL